MSSIAPGRDRSRLVVPAWPGAITGALIVFAVLLEAPVAHAALVLNELQASNASTIPDEAGDFEDWIEVLNTGPGTVVLTGMFLSDNLLVPTRWQIPALTLAPGERAFFIADAEMAEGPLHTNFRLNDAGEEVGLFDTLANGNLPIDTVIFGEQATDRSYGRFPDGSGPWIYMATPTPRAANVDQGNIPPLVTATDHEPNSPVPGQEVVVTSRIRDLDGSLSETRLFYDAGGGFVSIALFDDGLHGDGAPGDQVHGALVTGYPDGTTVRYYVRARDEDLDFTYDPAGAPGATYSYVVGYEQPPLFVNEFMASNTATIQDEWGEFDDWVEIYNAGAAPITLTGMTLTDNLSIPNKYTFPATVLGPRDFILVWCDNQPVQGPYHAPFALSAAGEQIGLFAPAQTGYAPIDTLSFGPQGPDVSSGREPDGGAVWRLYARATPGQSNQIPIAVDEAPAPTPSGLVLAAPEPNPFSRETTVRFTLPAASEVTLALHDVMGRRVALIQGGRFTAGVHAMALGPALERSGAAVGGSSGSGALPSGVYFLVLETRTERRIQKLSVVR